MKIVRAVSRREDRRAHRRLPGLIGLTLVLAASTVRVEGNQVIVAPQNWVIDLATGKVISQ